MAVSRLNGWRLPRKDETFLAEIWDSLKASGASEEDITNATPGISKALFAMSRINTLTQPLIIIINGIVLPAIISLPLFMVVLLENEHSSGHQMFIVMVLAISLGWVFWVVQKLPDILIDRLYVTSISITSFYGIVAFAYSIMLVYFGLEIWKDRVIYIEKMSIWDFVIIILGVGWMASLTNIFLRWSRLVYRRIFAYLRPDSALIISLCHAFLAVRNEASWHDKHHRDRIAGQLAVAADAIAKFMPRNIAAEAGLSSVAAVRQRFNEAAIPLRQRIVWLATPGPLTRTDLEAELRQAIVAASLGELARLEEVPDRTETIHMDRRPWWVVVTDLCRGIAWALIPLGLVQLGSALQLPLLSDHDQQATAQKAAYLWLALAILRGLSPGNFKETMEAAGSLLGRSKTKGAE